VELRLLVKLGLPLVVKLDVLLPHQMMPGNLLLVVLVQLDLSVPNLFMLK